MTSESQAVVLARLQAIDGTPGLDDRVLNRPGRMVAQRTRLYPWAWQLAVAGGLGFAILVAQATIH